MSDTFTTLDGITVDDIPVKFNSEDILTDSFEVDPTLTVSGAAADAKVTGDEIGGIKKAICEKDIPILSAGQNSAIVLDGARVTCENGVPTLRTVASPFWTYFTECSEGDMFIVDGTGGNGARLYGFLSVDEDQTSARILQVATVQAVMEYELIVAPKGTNAVCFNFVDAIGKAYKVEGLSKMVSDNTEQMIALDRANFLYNLVLSNVKYTPNWVIRIIEDSLSMLYDASMGYTDYIPVEGGHIYYTNVSNSQYFVWFDENYTPISVVNGSSVLAPPDAKYLVLSTNKNAWSNVIISVNMPIVSKAEALHELNDELGDDLSLDITYDRNTPCGINNTSGDLQTAPVSAMRATDYLDISGYASLTMITSQLSFNSPFANVAVYNQNKELLTTVQKKAESGASVEKVCIKINLSSEAKYVRFTIRPDITNFYLRGLKKAYDANPVYDSFEGLIRWTGGGIRNTDGQFTSGVTSGFIATEDYIDVSAYNRIAFSGMARIGETSTLASMACYDSDKQYLKGYSYLNYDQNKRINAEVILPDGTKYVRFSYNSSYEEFYARGLFSEREPDLVKNHIRFMVFGNSYGCDSMSYVPFILKNLGITCELVMHVRDACSLRDIYNRWESSDPRDSETDGIHSGSYQRFVVSIDTRTDNAWKQITRRSMKDVVELGNWDFISLQQWSAYSIDPDTYEPWLSLDLELLSQAITRGTQLAWLQVWTRATHDDQQASISTFENTVYKNYPFDFYIPCGTAIFNARANQTIAEIGAGTNLWAEDRVHLQDGLGCYIAACTIVESICRHFGFKRSCFGDKTEIQTSWSIPEAHLPIVGMTSENRLLAQKAAIMACNHPFNINRIDFSPYVEFETYSAFPANGQTGTLYKDLDTGMTYTWDGTSYVYNRVDPYVESN